MTTKINFIAFHMTKEEAIEKLQRQLQLIDGLISKPKFSQDFQKWQRDTEIAIERIFGSETRHLKDFTQIHYSLLIASNLTSEQDYINAFRRGLESARSLLESLIQEVEDYWSDLTVAQPPPRTLEIIERICNRFHLVAIQLRARHNNRPTLEIENEYDVQDLFQALLKLYFDDIRPEEVSPTCAGSSSRMDFLLMSERTVIEIKKTRRGLAAKEIGEQLIIDIERYKAHPFCKMLVCFVYDPEGRISNPRGIENDLNRTTDRLTVRVFITPTGV
jgi:hypothetical protein